MLEMLPLLCLATAILLLVALSLIDLKHYILPDELNLALGVCGVMFHFLTTYMFLDIKGMILGALTGAGLLYTIRFFSNRYYGRDTLGLGDVKLMAAAGVWLGVGGVLEAITVGAFMGLLHGLFHAGVVSFKTKTPYSIAGLSIPAGPGFAIGIVLIGAFMFDTYMYEAVHALLA